MNAYDNWWHIAHSPDAIHVHHLPPADLAGAARRWLAAHPNTDDGQPTSPQMATAEAAGAYAQAIRDALGFPTDWFHAEGWTSALSPGTPHPKLMARVCQGCDLPAHDGVPEPGI